VAEVQGMNNLQQERSEQAGLHETWSMAEMEEQAPQKEGLEEPISSISHESIKEISKVLTGHEHNLKNLLEAYSQLQLRLEQLQLKQQREESQNLSWRATEDLQSATIDLKMLKVRLGNADKNLVVLQKQLALKDSELET
jgi:vesicle coat complex subunit